MTPTSRLYAAGILLIAVALVFSSCSRTSQAGARSEPDLATTVAVATIAPDTISQEIVLTGEFRPYQVADLHAKVAGYLKKINVDVGDRVKAGQLVATLEIPEMHDDVTQAEASRKRSSSELQRESSEVARADAERAMVELSYNRLVSVSKKEPGLIAQQEIDEAAARKRAAEARVAAAKAAHASAQQQIEVSKAGEQRAKTMAEYTQIVAPFSGVITKRYADAGAMIQAGTASQSQAMPVVRVAQIDHLRLVVAVPESAVPRIRVGGQVLIRVNALAKSFAGTISRFSDDVQMATRTMDTEIDVPNGAGVLVPGMYADVTITLVRRDKILTVPIQAITTREGVRTVLVVTAAGLIEERKLTVGIETPLKLEAVAGVQPGDLVIIGNRSQLKAGQKVQAKAVGIS